MGYIGAAGYLERDRGVVEGYAIYAFDDAIVLVDAWRPPFRRRYLMPTAGLDDKAVSQLTADSMTRDFRVRFVFFTKDLYLVVMNTPIFGFSWQKGRAIEFIPYDGRGRKQAFYVSGRWVARVAVLLNQALESKFEDRR